MKHRMVTDRMRRICVANAESERLALKWVLKNKELPQQARMLAMFRLAEMPKNTSFHRLFNMCVVTGRRRAVIPEFGISRHIFRSEALAGHIDGITKAHW